MIDSFLIIIGAMRSGTTSLFRYLSQHPEIAPASVKEPNFFGDDSAWSRGFDWYESLWDFNPNIHQVALEGSTQYTKWPQHEKVFERMANARDAGRRFRLVYLLRNPVDRIESHLAAARDLNWDPPLYSPNGFVQVCHPLNVSRYALQIDRVLEHFDRSDLLLLDYDELRQDPQSLVEKVLGFAHVSLDSQELIDTDQIYNSAQERLGRMSSQFNPASGRVKLAPKERWLVQRTLESDLQRLSSFHGFDTSGWFSNGPR